MAQAIRALFCAVVTIVFGLLAVPSGADSLPNGSAPHLRMRLVVEGGAPQVGQPVTLALDTIPEAGWHGYWSNPGDAGFAPKFDWSVPAGTRIGAVQWPVPTTLTVAGLMNYVYERPYAPLVTLTVPAMRGGQSLPIRLHTSYLVCTATLCVPEEQTLSIAPVATDGAAGVRDARFDRWRAELPRPLGGTATIGLAGGVIRLAVPFPAGASIDRAYFFPAAGGAIDLAAPQGVARDGDRLVIETKPVAGVAKLTPIDGVLRIGDGRGLSIHAMPGDVPPVQRSGTLRTALLAFAGAVLGGLLLNVMPCVFPILSLKALALARGGVDGREARVEALAYTAGVVIVCVGLGAVILGLRAGGTMVGWAFQLQDPRVVLVLLLLCVGIALNLSGAFEFSTPSIVGRGGSGGAFATGALAAFVATPCTGPFMAAALGAALVLPAAAALAVFAGLGLGLALPFLLIGFVPALRRMLPRPGRWMVTLRRVLAVPMWLTAAALAWLLWRQAGTTGLAVAIVAAVIAAVLLSLGGRRQARGLGFGAAMTAGLALLVPLSVGATQLLPSSAPKVGGGDAPFSEGKLATLRAEKRPVFAYFTADWCLTCKVNEKAAIDTRTARDGFAQHDVTVLVGDWTDGDPALGRFIEAHNRAGVPLYLFYPAGGGEPRVLPQVLTPGLLGELGA
ncbi:Thiol:disulfide interchange protein [Sphingomonas gellani]|uniref:Thiol:disulfide interchange protein n=1 Tax=Sphingomonas gellani TaxID=1166340 RepID=A0A1H8EEB5_9SPHN|nr:protein-disulfide reductase DsbD domain-containing protein [Sphingomonas gellani]SEN17813.1 Thiol:disulfide interchange protein [Sphingomonas gellani]